MKTVKLQVNSRDFLNWFYSDTFDFGTGFDYENFKFSCDSSLSFSYVDIRYTCCSVPEPMRLYTVYGRLRSMYETQTKIAIKVHYSENEAENLMYEYIVSFRCMMLWFTTCREYPAFAWAKITGTKPVLCLESESELRRQATREILESIEQDYYSESELCDEWPNECEIRYEWMQCIRYSDNTGDNTGDNRSWDIYTQAIYKAWNWVRWGVLNDFISVK